MKEKWCDITGYENCYRVSSFGRVESLPRIITNSLGVSYPLDGRILKPGLTTDGYLTVLLCQNGERRTRYVHDLVAIAFIGPKPSGLDVLHGKQGKKCNHVSNLRYGTRQENILQKYADGTMPLRSVRRSDGKVFASIKEAAAATGLCKYGSGIINAIRGHGGAQSAGGYTWEYTDEE